MGEVDLDAARQARYEAKKGNKVRFGGRVFQLVPELTLDAAEAYDKNDARGFLEAALVDPAKNVGPFVAAHPSWEDIRNLLNAFRVSPGESPASSRSSTNGGKRSRPTSKRTTKSS